ncbi:hypothetical protein Q4575_14035 [Psychrosphaera sp. 1_MG-2023]|uniref:hypothetical protein n=1 Tax=Psychrosphaera sp. 1_MG-2023 TaxID=3062643 RepID=UPI0026E3086C|nr:hypothetical protein [Psychrosphaera sp. 1_MG-2023]MDO6720534.1 hypothetical protein [Psychrosphaera sp. 1_MG-2023]
MFQQMVRLTLAATIWRKYRNYIVGILSLVAFWLLLNFIHQDYLSYAQLDVEANQSMIAYSYVLKWGLILLSAGVFIRYVKKPLSSDKNKTLQREMEKSHKINKESPVSASSETLENDPFANIRTKKSLRSEADFVLEKSADKKK